MNNILAAFAVAILFGLGLGVSGMTDPAKVVGFLDITGKWDPSLMFVMVGSIAVHFFTYPMIRKKSSPLFSAEWHVPTKRDVTPSLVLGSVLFGVGWALAGYCPGPAITSAASFDVRTLTFVVFMLVGMGFFFFADRFVKFRR